MEESRVEVICGGVLCRSTDMARDKMRKVFQAQLRHLEPRVSVKHHVCCTDNVFVSVRAVWAGVLFTPPVDCLGAESCRQAKNNHLNNERKKKMSESLSCCVVQQCDKFPCADDFDLENFFTDQSRLKIAKNPNFDSTSILQAYAACSSNCC